MHDGCGYTREPNVEQCYRDSRYVAKIQALLDGYAGVVAGILQFEPRWRSLEQISSLQLGCYWLDNRMLVRGRYLRTWDVALADWSCQSGDCGAASGRSSGYFPPPDRPATAFGLASLPADRSNPADISMSSQAPRPRKCRTALESEFKSPGILQICERSF
ncbi:MAG: hypothetical protein A3K04_08025 [Gallionellales bacterium RBG_16_56_9]|nr:MAG: hypothetical protein A3K04_08025 [Gallionellales bacterium RBG_16_56_9]